MTNPNHTNVETTGLASDFDFSNKTFMVTGGAGFIGSHTVHHLLERGASVVVVDEFNDFYDPAIKELNIQPFKAYPPERFSLYRTDLRNMEALSEIFKRHGNKLKTGGIIHLAGRAGVRPSLAKPRLYLESNVTATLNLAEQARAYGIKKFVFASSSSVYGSSPESAPFNETQDVTKPISPYASTKIMCESLLHTYYHLYNMQVVALRFFTVYGPGQRPDLAIHKFTKLIDAGKTIPVFGDGSTRRDYTHINDIVQGILSAIAYDKTPFEIINLGESQTTTLARLIELIEDALGKNALIDRQPLQPGDVPITFANIDKARRLLGYQPTTLVEQGIPDFVKWYRHFQAEQQQATVSV